MKIVAHFVFCAPPPFHSFFLLLLLVRLGYSDTLSTCSSSSISLGNSNNNNNNKSDDGSCRSNIFSFVEYTKSGCFNIISTTYSHSQSSQSQNQSMFFTSILYTYTEVYAYAYRVFGHAVTSSLPPSLFLCNSSLDVVFL